MSGQGIVHLIAMALCALTEWTTGQAKGW